MQLDIAHVCIIVRDLERAMERFRSIWGTGPFRVLDSDHPDGIVHGKNITVEEWPSLKPVPSKSS
jgi:hypothetical protein